MEVKDMGMLSQDEFVKDMESVYSNLLHQKT